MSADLLRRAAAKIRETARGATTGPWEARDSTDGEPSVFTPDGLEHEVDYLLVGTHGRAQGRRDAEHIALWSPDVAELVAATLDRNYDTWVNAADRRRLYDDPRLSGEPCMVLARRILGEDA